MFEASHSGFGFSWPEAYRNAEDIIFIQIAKMMFLIFSQANLRVSFLFLLCFYSGKRACTVFKAF